MDVLVAGIANGGGKRFAGHDRNGRFASRIDIEQRQNVGLIECAAEFVPKMLGARVGMRLEEHEQAIELAAAGRLERGTNLGGVMAVVVNDGDLVDHALDVKAAAHAGKLSETFADQVCRNVQVQGDGGGGGGIENVVHAGRMRQAEQTEIFASVGEPELAAQTLQLHVTNHQIGLARSSISNDGALHAGNDGLHIGLVDAEDRRAVKRHAIHKLDKGVLNVLERGVLVEMFAINRGDDRDHRREHQEAAVALVRFDHKVFAFAEPRGGTRLVDSPTDDKGGVKMRGR